METYHDQVTSVNQPLAAGVANALALSCLLSPSCLLNHLFGLFYGYLPKGANGPCSGWCL